jgi:tRNA (cmo5U34)-methyltransferase
VLQTPIQLLFWVCRLRCSNCGSENPSDKKFCGDCGARLDASAPIRSDKTGGTPPGERRHLTVLFRDLVNSTSIAAQLDPEEWREIVASYHRVATEAITRSASRKEDVRMAEQFDFDRNPLVTETYERGPRWFVPGYDASHAMAAVLLRDRLGEEGHILVVGAGGGVELSVFARECNGWKFTGVDPSAEMLRQARVKLEGLEAADRVTWVQGEVERSAKGPFDAATSFLALNFVDVDRRLAILREIHSRLKPGALFLLIDGCSDRNSKRFDDDLRVYAAFARRNGAPTDVVERAVAMQRESLYPVRPEHEEALLSEAGFVDARLFYAGFWVFGWIALA